MGKVNRGKGKQYGQGGAAFPFMVRDEGYEMVNAIKFVLRFLSNLKY